jgi:hypothetical protein
VPKKPEPRINPNPRTQQSPDADMLMGRPAQAAKALAAAIAGIIPQGSPIRGGDAETQRMAKGKKDRAR